MSGYHQAARPMDLQPHSTDTPVSSQIGETSFLEDVEALVKCSIWNRCSQPAEQLIAINVGRSKSGRRGYEVKYARLEASGEEEFATKSIFSSRQSMGNINQHGNCIRITEI